MRRDRSADRRQDHRAGVQLTRAARETDGSAGEDTVRQKYEVGQGGSNPRRIMPVQILQVELSLQIGLTIMVLIVLLE